MQNCAYNHSSIFADDSLIFLKADIINARFFKQILEDYEFVSGQKTKLWQILYFFSPNCVCHIRDEIKDIARINSQPYNEKYLGLSTILSRRSKNVTFMSSKYKVWKRIQGWKGKILRIKVVAQSITTYSMNCFLLSYSLCHEISQLFTNVWWGSSTNKKKIHWSSFGID